MSDTEKDIMKTIIITGASDGIGAASARQLATAGHDVVLVGRSPQKTAAVAKQINAPYHVADFTDLAQVRRLADELLAAHPQIDVLANNAGGLFGHETTTDGFDKTFQVNHLAPFLLTNLLMDRLLTSRAALIQTSSVGAKAFGNLDLDDLNNTKKWGANKAYGDGKLANILFTQELHRRYHDRGLSAVAFHPGNVATNFASDTSSPIRWLYRTPLSRLILVDAGKGGAALTWLAAGTPGVTWQSGAYYEKNKPVPEKKLHAQARDASVARGLWERSEALLQKAGA
ncbi:SDR family NAD(P)-dependent oxidoreductase [Cryptosporangium aurantiacum]|uniref:Short-chain dehydrogenase n=1 Tax=Cryptosporangium aurantiacum TaxID=134849 RepID=A0A1M7R3J1_9ACTN|nr:SDR family NAD(P)-dependent oxidoreductase [Cryptosporangium aurantiacum]SHN39713.1 Short-chain dehydrogenase [Cryptosporangium aurantiacum]